MQAVVWVLAALCVGDVVPEGQRTVPAHVVLENIQAYPGYHFVAFPVGASRAEPKALKVEPDPENGGRAKFRFYHAYPPHLFASKTPLGLERLVALRDELQKKCAASCTPKSRLAFWASKGVARSDGPLRLEKSLPRDDPAVGLAFRYSIQNIENGRIDLKLRIEKLAGKRDEPPTPSKRAQQPPSSIIGALLIASIASLLIFLRLRKRNQP